MITYKGLFLQATLHLILKPTDRENNICITKNEILKKKKKVKKRKEDIIVFPTSSVDEGKALEGLLMLFIWLVLFHCCFCPES